MAIVCLTDALADNCLSGGVISIKRLVSKRPANPTPRVWLARNGAVLVTVIVVVLVVVLVASHDASRCR